jgi:predicted ArsR family transcriptional regulator
MGPDAQFVKILVDLLDSALSFVGTEEERTSRRWWERQIGGTTRGRIIALLRRGASTIEELARALEVTDNAVRPHVQLLEREGLLNATGTRQGPGAGKPATTYALSAEAESALSGAYAPVLTTLLRTLETRMGKSELEALLRDVGRQLGPGQPESGPLDARVQAAAALLSGLGSELDVERNDAGYVLRGYACPLATAVRGQPAACQAVEELVQSVVGAPVRECCDRTEGTPRCRFEVVAK